MDFTTLPTEQQNFLEHLLSRKGQIVTVKTQRALQVRKGQPEATKTSEFQCRVGVNYDNIATVKEGRANGELPAQNAGLPWGEWAVFPYVIAHKDQLYVRCTMLDNAFRRSPVFALADGTQLTKAEAQAMSLASEFKEGDNATVFNIKLSSILEVK